MSFIHWTEWTKPRAWRKLAEIHTDKSGERYVPIGYEGDGEDGPYELLRLSRYSPKFDADRLALRTSIRQFEDMPVEMSRRTRDLGIARFITSKGKPIFVLEPGADVLRWTAIREEVTELELINIARRGDIGRAVRRKDRKALKASQQEVEAKIRGYQEYIQRLEIELAQSKIDLSEAENAHGRMVQNIVNNNEREGTPQAYSGRLASVLGAAQERGVELISNKPLPGNFGG